MNSLKDVFNNFANNRAIKLIQKTSKNQANPTMPEQKIKFQELIWELSDQIIRVKYEKHPNWKRVETTFKEVKSELAETVQDLKISSQIKKKLITKLDSVQLTLPFIDPKFNFGVNNCASTEKNAY